MVDAIYSAIGLTQDARDANIQQFINDLFFDTCSENMLKFYEKEAGIVPLESQTIDDRRYAVAAKWKSNGICDLTLLQAVANSWHNRFYFIFHTDTDRTETLGQ